MNVEQVGPSFYVGTLCTGERSLNLGRISNDLSFNPECAGCFGEIDVRAAIVGGHVLARLKLLSRDEAKDSVAFVIIASVIDDNVRDRSVVARLAPKRLRTAEQSTSIAC